MGEINAVVNISGLEESIRQVIREEISTVLDKFIKSQQTENTKLKLLDMAETCTYLRLSRGSIYKLIKAGLLESKKAGNKRLFEMKAIEKYLKR